MFKLSKTDRFQWKVTLIASGGYFLDGYVLGIIGPVMLAMNTDFQLTPSQSGLLASAILLGIFVGAMFFGYVTDKIGRQKLMIFDLAAFIILSILQFFAVDITQLVILRFLLGVAIGADYALASPLVAEFSSQKNRGPMLATVLTSFYVGYLGAVLASVAILQVGDNAWRWMLISSAIPAIIIFVLRLGIPESPRWLINKGRIEEAREVMRKFLGEELDISKMKNQINKPTKFSRIFEKSYRKRLAFATIFWTCQVAPYFAIFSFAPIVLQGLNIKDPVAGELILNSLVLFGAICGIFLVNKVGRRNLLIIPFAITVIPLTLLGLFPGGSTVFVIICFGVYALAYSVQSVLQSVYPPELFPTEVRGTAMGFASGGSRIGAAIGTFLLPIGISTIGIGPSMLFGAAILVLGTIIAIMWAPETTHLTIEEASEASSDSGNIVKGNQKAVQVPVK
ncbi:MFS transporter [Sporosarcina jiandibaonis]|uniref:MFS transporter n=1 Tax=Sporosarcina jiandibaonis TaxID=2715535 RepID=UPI001553D7DB|nr:MFS transporter [Sporosarcina jiandibaonis]